MDENYPRKLAELQSLYLPYLENWLRNNPAPTEQCQKMQTLHSAVAGNIKCEKVLQILKPNSRVTAAAATKTTAAATTVRTTAAAATTTPAAETPNNKAAKTTTAEATTSAANAKAAAAKSVTVSGSQHVVKKELCSADGATNRSRSLNDQSSSSRPMERPADKSGRSSKRSSSRWDQPSCPPNVPSSESATVAPVTEPSNSKLSDDSSRYRSQSSSHRYHRFDRFGDSKHRSDRSHDIADYQRHRSTDDDRRTSARSDRHAEKHRDRSNDDHHRWDRSNDDHRSTRSDRPSESHHRSDRLHRRSDKYRNRSDRSEHSDHRRSDHSDRDKVAEKSPVDVQNLIIRTRTDAKPVAPVPPQPTPATASSMPQLPLNERHIGLAPKQQTQPQPQAQLNPQSVTTAPPPLCAELSMFSLVQKAMAAIDRLEVAPPPTANSSSHLAEISAAAAAAIRVISPKTLRAVHSALETARSSAGQLQPVPPPPTHAYSMSRPLLHYSTSYSAPPIMPLLPTLGVSLLPNPQPPPPPPPQSQQQQHPAMSFYNSQTPPATASFNIGAPLPLHLPPPPPVSAPLLAAADERLALQNNPPTRAQWQGPVPAPEMATASRDPRAAARNTNVSLSTAGGGSASGGWSADATRSSLLDAATVPRRTPQTYGDYRRALRAGQDQQQKATKQSEAALFKSNQSRVQHTGRPRQLSANSDPASASSAPVRQSNTPLPTAAVDSADAEAIHEQFGKCTSSSAAIQPSTATSAPPARSKLDAIYSGGGHYGGQIAASVQQINAKIALNFKIPKKTSGPVAKEPFNPSERQSSQEPRSSSPGYARHDPRPAAEKNKQQQVATKRTDPRLAAKAKRRIRQPSSSGSESEKPSSTVPSVAPSSTTVQSPPLNPVKSMMADSSEDVTSSSNTTVEASPETASAPGGTMSQEYLLAMLSKMVDQSKFEHIQQIINAGASTSATASPYNAMATISQTTSPTTTTPTAKTPNPIRKRLNELEILNDDIFTMYMCDDVLKATGPRKCTLPKPVAVRNRQRSGRKSAKLRQSSDSDPEDDDAVEEEEVAVAAPKRVLKRRNTVCVERAAEFDNLEASVASGKTLRRQRRTSTASENQPVPKTARLRVQTPATSQRTARKSTAKAPSSASLLLAANVAIARLHGIPTCSVRLQRMSPAQIATAISKATAALPQNRSSSGSSASVASVSANVLSQLEALILKNTNRSMHAANAELNSTCLLCDFVAHSKNNEVSRSRKLMYHYTNEHRSAENYLARLPPRYTGRLALLKPAQLLPKSKFKVRQRCVFCGQSHDWSYKNWLEHYSAHTGEYMYECAQCGTLNPGGRHGCPHKGHVNRRQVPQLDCAQLRLHVCKLCNWAQFGRDRVERHLHNQHAMAAGKVVGNVLVVDCLRMPADWPWNKMRRLQWEAAEALKAEQAEPVEAEEAEKEVEVEQENASERYDLDPSVSRETKPKKVRKAVRKRPVVESSSSENEEDTEDAAAPVPPPATSNLSKSMADRLSQLLKQQDVQQATEPACIELRTPAIDAAADVSRLEPLAPLALHRRPTVDKILVARPPPISPARKRAAEVEPPASPSPSKLICLPELQIIDSQHSTGKQTEDVRKEGVDQWEDCWDDDVMEIFVEGETRADAAPEVAKTEEVVVKSLSFSINITPATSKASPATPKEPQTMLCDIPLPIVQPPPGQPPVIMPERTLELSARVMTRVRVDNIGYSQMISASQPTFCCLMDRCGFESPLMHQMSAHLQQHASTNWTGFCFMCDKQIHPVGAYSLIFELTHMYSVHIINEKPQQRPTISVPRLPDDHQLSANEQQQQQLQKPEPPQRTATTLQITDIQSLAPKQTTAQSAPPTTAKPMFVISSVCSTAAAPIQSPPSPASAVVAPTSLAATTSRLVNCSLKPWLPQPAGRKTTAAFHAQLLPISLCSLYKCMAPNCEFSANKADSMLAHLRLHSVVRQAATSSPATTMAPSWLECSYCDWSAATEEALVRHVGNEHATSIFQCTQCFYRSCAAANVTAHQRELHLMEKGKEMVLLCVGAPRQLRQELPMIDAGRRLHVPQLLCDSNACEKRFYTIEAYQLHLNAAHPAGIVCSICNRSVALTDILQHNLTSHQLGRYQCVHCPFGTNSVQALRSHLWRQHSNRLMYMMGRVLRDSVHTKQFKFDLADALEDTALVYCGQSVDKRCFRKLSASVNLNNAPTMLAPNVAGRPPPAGPSSVSGGGSQLEIVVVNSISVEAVQQHSLSMEQIINLAECEKYFKIAALKIAKSAKLDSIPVCPLQATNPTSAATTTTPPSDAAHRFPNLPAVPSTSTALQPPRHTDLVLQEIHSAALWLTAETGKQGRDLYQCAQPGCSATADDAMALNVHLLKHIGDCGTGGAPTQFQCRHCAAPPMQQINGLMKHLQTHGRHLYLCFFCDYTGPSAGELSKHMRETHMRNEMMLQMLDSRRKGQPDCVIVGCPNTVRATEMYGFGLRLLERKKREASKKVYWPGDEDDLPKQSILAQAVGCGQCCKYESKVRTNLVRHLQSCTGHSLSEVDGSERAVADPVDPVPCLENGDKHADRMCNLASGSNEVVMVAKATAARVNRAAAEDMGTKNAECSAVDQSLIISMYVPERDRFVCNVPGCRYLTINATMLHNHLSTLHTNESNWQCPHCQINLGTGNVYHIIGHLQWHDKRVYKCSKCSYTNSARLPVESHVKSEHLYAVSDPQQAAAAIPGTSASPTVAESKRSTGRPKPPDSDVPTTSKMWHCILCSEVFLGRALVAKHVKDVHCIMAQYQCEVCKMQTNYRNQMESHMTSKHAGNDYCEVKFFYERVPLNIQPEETTPIWRRNDPDKVKNIRGILVDDEEEETTKSPLKNLELTVEPTLSVSCFGSEDADMVEHPKDDFPDGAAELSSLSYVTVKNKRVGTNMEINDSTTKKPRKSATELDQASTSDRNLNNSIVVKQESIPSYIFLCKYCSKRFFTSSEVLTHWETWHKYKNFGQQKVINENEPFRYHIDYYLRCIENNCKKSRILQRGWRIHCAQFHPNGPNCLVEMNNPSQCGTCAYSNPDQSHMQAHFREAHAEPIVSSATLLDLPLVPIAPHYLPELLLGGQQTRVNCLSCHETMATRDDFDRHQRLSHPRGDALLKILPEAPRYGCSICSVTADTEQTIVQHLQHHNMYKFHKKYQCVHCDEAFGTKISVRDHCIKAHGFNTSEWRLTAIKSRLEVYGRIKVILPNGLVVCKDDVKSTEWGDMSAIICELTDIESLELAENQFAYTCNARAARALPSGIKNRRKTMR